MTRFLVFFILFGHGVIHLLGFVKELNLGVVKQLSGKTLFTLTGTTAKSLGILWLITCMILIFAAAAYLMRSDWWWIAAITGVILSQTLIIIYWPDAKYGTIANIIILIACILAYGKWDFGRMVRREIPDFMPGSSSEKVIVTEDMLKGLPPVIGNWLRHTGIVGKEIIRTAHLSQTGQMKSKPDGNWMPFCAEQHFTLDRPGFHWTVDVEAMPVMNLTGRDIYKDGSGNMLIKIMSLVPVVNSKGKEINQGSMLRFLAEAAWMPSFALSSYLKWEESDSTTAKVTMTYGGVTASGVFKFNRNCDMVGFEAMRYFERKEGPTLEKWVIETKESDFKEFEGIRIPYKSAVTWKLKSGDYHWLDVEIAKIEYNKVTF